MSKGIQTNKFRRFVTVFAVLGSLCTLVAFTYADKFKQHPIKLTIAEGGDDDEPLSENCGGGWRWDVKVITDTAAYRLVLTPKPTSIFHLVTMSTPAPDSIMARYNPIEDSVYMVVGTIIAKRVEADSDYHIVISDGNNNTMITEIPDPNCNTVMASPYTNDFAIARRWIDSVIGPGTYTALSVRNVAITGQAYIDPPHGQSGAAPNNMELHAILRIRFNTPAGINTFSASEGLDIYPNPSRGVFTISMPGANNNEEKVEIYNMLGEKISESRIISNKGQINITGQPQGIYLYKIADENGGYISTGKLIIQ